MKIDKESVIETALGFLIAGVILMVLGGLFGGWIAAHGAKITGVKADGSNFEDEQ